MIRSEVQMLHWWAPREKYFLAHHLLKNEYVYHFLWHKNITSYYHSYIALQLWPIHIFLEHFLHPDFLKNALNSRTPRDLKHFGNPKNEILLRSLKFYGENEFLVEMCRNQLITEKLSFVCFHKNFMTNISFQIAKKLSRVQLFWRHVWIWLTP